MWTCPKCERVFQKDNQSHICNEVDLDSLFEGKPDELVLAFDDLVQMLVQWEPFHMGVAVHSIVVTSQKAWLILKPMKKELDIKFYSDSPVESDRIKRITEYRGKYAHHIRVSSPEQLNDEVYRLLREGFEWSMRSN